MRLFSTLYRKIAALLFGLLLVVGAAFLLLAGYSSERYQQEVMQKLNLDLARQLVESRPLLVDSRVNHNVINLNP